MSVVETGRSGRIVSGGGEDPTMYVSERVPDLVKDGITDRLLWGVHSLCLVKLEEGQRVTISADGMRAYTEDGDEIISWSGEDNKKQD